MGSIPANSDAQNVPSFRRWRFEMKLSPFFFTYFAYCSYICIILKNKGTKLHFKSPTAERRHVLCVGVGGDRTHASRPGGALAGYARLSPTRLGGTYMPIHADTCIYLHFILSHFGRVLCGNTCTYTHILTIYQQIHSHTCTYPLH